MIILGVESTAHTFGVGIVDSYGNILANVMDSFSSTEGGMIPDLVMEHHEKVADDVLSKALEKADLDWDKIDLIAYSAGPGIDPILWIGYHKAKEWSEKHDKKLVGVNHCAAHLSIGKKIHDLEDPVYLYVSGVNTQVLVFDGGKYRVMGETLDIGLGNMLDKLGRVLELGFPAGAEIEKLAKEGKYIELPYAVKGMDVSFSGILTKAQQLIAIGKAPKGSECKVHSSDKPGTVSNSTDQLTKSENKGVKETARTSISNEKGISKEDLSFSIQETCFAMMAEVSERALAHTGKKELLLVGGVGCNKRFCEMLSIMCVERGAKFYMVPMDLVRDNGAMIAWEGFLRKDNPSDVKVNSQWRTDEVE